MIRKHRCPVLVALLAVSAGAVCGPRAASATYISSDERIEASAQVSTQGTGFHDEFGNIEYVQQRNEVKLGFRYFLVPTDQDLLFMHRPRLSILWRGRYDSVFDSRAKYRNLGYDRMDFRFPEGQLPRELFFDFDLTAPLDFLSFRFGKQQVVWGEADLFRSLDIINPLRLDQNGLVGENFDDYREPLWIFKGLASIGEIPYFSSNTAVEFFYSPNGRPLTNRAVVGEAFRIGVDQNFSSTGGFDPTLTRPNSTEFSRIRHPWEISRVGEHRTDAPNYADQGADQTTCADLLGCGDFVYQIHDDMPRKLFDFDASMVGVRMLGQTYGGIDFTLNYVYKRTEVPGTALAVNDIFDANRPAAPGSGPLGINARLDKLATAALAELTPDMDGNGVPDGRDELIRQCIFEQVPGVVVLAGLHGPHRFPQGASPTGTAQPGGTYSNPFTGCEDVQFWYPWQHVIGVTGTYNDFSNTGAIFRFEGSFASKEPRTNQPPLAADRAGQFPTRYDFESHLKRNTQVIRTMIGFDYLRTIWSQPPLWLRRTPILGSLFYDQWFFTFQFFNEYHSHADRLVGLLDSTTDRMQHFNPVLTYVMTGFFDKNRLRPFIAVGYDVNAEFPVLWTQFEYFLTPKLALRLANIEYMGSRNAESFLFLHKYADRDTVFARLTYFIL